MLAVPAVVKALPTTAPKTGTALAANVYAYANDVCQNDAAYSSLEGYSGADSYCRSMLPSLDLAVMVPVVSTAMNYRGLGGKSNADDESRRPQSQPL